MHYKKTTLKNGLRIITAPMQDMETVTVLVMTATGSRHETRRENGIAHFLEHMLFKGTKSRPTAMDIARELDGIGAEYNAFTSKEFTGYYAKVDKRHAMTALDVVSDIFLNAKLEQEEIDRERGTILQEINMFEDSPARRVGEYFEHLLYEDAPLGWDIAGPKENIKRFQRFEFVKYMKRGYVAKNVVVGVAGNFHEQSILTEVRKRFHGIAGGKKPIFKEMKESQRSPGVYMHTKKTDQTHLVIGSRAYDMYHKDRYVVSILAALLGGGMSSRLFFEVRERRGLAYRVSTGVEAYQDAGYIATQCGIEHENLEEVIRVILKEYYRIAQETVGGDELRKAKEYIKGRLSMGLEGSDDVIEYLVMQETLRNHVTLPDEIAKRVDAVTEKDVARVAKDIFQNNTLNLALIGPHKNKKKMEKLLRLD